MEEQAADPIGSITARLGKETFTGGYRDVAAFVEQQAQLDAQNDRPQPSKVKAKAFARKAAATLKQRLDLSMEGTQLEGATSEQIMGAVFRDLRQAYSSVYTDQLVARHRLIQEENKKAIEVALEMLL